MHNIATPRFTRRHYRALAEAIGRASEYPRDGIVGAIVAMLAADNPKFLATTFRTAINNATMETLGRADIAERLASKSC